MEILILINVVIGVLLFNYLSGKKKEPNNKQGKSEKSLAQSKQETVAPKRAQASKEIDMQEPLIDSLEHYKPRILGLIEFESLSSEDSWAVWDNRKKYNFSDDEMKKLELHLTKAKPRIVNGQNVYSCSKCLMVGNSCTCKLSRN